MSALKVLSLPKIPHLTWNSVTKLRCLSTVLKEKYDFNKAVNDAEKLIGYPTSFMTLKWLLSDEIPNITGHFQKLIGSNHPMLRTLIYNGNTNVQAWGLIVQLVSKATGQGVSTFPESEIDKSAGILHSQRSLAEITEMIRIGHTVHQSLINFGMTENDDPDLEDLNKMSLLFGDFLLTTANSQIAKFRNQDVGRLISTALRDLCESNFIGDRDEQDHPLPSDPETWAEEKKCVIEADNTDNQKPFNVKGVMGDPEREWTLRTTLSTASLLGKSCEAALKLGKHPKELQQQFFTFGRHLALAWQASIDLEPFISKLFSGEKFSLVCAPVLFHLKHEKSLYEEIKKGVISVDNVDYEKVRDLIIEGPALAKTRDLVQKHCLVSLEILNKEVKLSAARTSLENIIFALRSS